MAITTDSAKTSAASRLVRACCTSAPRPVVVLSSSAMTVNRMDWPTAAGAQQPRSLSNDGAFGVLGLDGQHRLPHHQIGAGVRQPRRLSVGDRVVSIRVATQNGLNGVATLGVGIGTAVGAGLDG